jgi:iron complex outermembrane recepter protein
MLRQKKLHLHISSSCMLLLAATSELAYAAEPTDKETKKEPVEINEVIITGSRIISDGFTQPTPTTTLSRDELDKSSRPNVFNAIVQLPSLQGSTGRSANTFSTSSGLQGLSAFGMRGLGTNRTLTLLDGQRVVGANFTGVTDVSQFPQLLIERVDVVTGGASASYGSDAIGGVVNFITNKKFEGFKANLSAGETTYGDDENVTVQAAWGAALNERMHGVLSGEFSREDGIPAHGFGTGSGPNGRDWFNSPAFQVRPLNQTNDGFPQRYYIEDAQQFQYAKFGLITSGPLQGTAFGVNGEPYTFDYGSNGVPTGSGGVTGCITPFCVGGEQDGNVGNGTSLAAEMERAVVYSRLSYDLTDNHELYATVNLTRVAASQEPNPGMARNANLTIQCENPFLPDSIRQQCIDNNITSFQFGSSNAGFKDFINVDPTRKQERFVFGADGNYDLFGAQWTYDTYYERGENITDIVVEDITLMPRYFAAIDAIALPDGSIVCRSETARNSGCKPLNIIGDVAIDPDALAYVQPAHGPHPITHQTQNVFSFNTTGEPFSVPAGPVAVATGIEYRREWYRTTADPYGNGVRPESPNTAQYPSDPLLNTTLGNNWYAGNYHSGKGAYDVKEGYVEFNVPIFSSDGAGEANINMAARLMEYSTAGSENTWKFGGTWQLPIDGVRLRAVTSRDVRAPNLSELYAPETVTNATVNYNGASVNADQRNFGNLALTPEIARSSEFGVVLSEPAWAPGFSMSVDYFDIDIEDVISPFSPQQEVDLCVAGDQKFCDVMELDNPPGVRNFVITTVFNQASMKSNGVDIETSYRSGSLTLRALATHTFSFEIDSGVLGTIPSEKAGVNLENVPDWKLLASQSWETDDYSVTLTERWFSDGVYSNEFIECQTGCPMATTNNPTIDKNDMKGALYFDLGGTYKVNSHVTAYANIDNLLNHDPEPAPATNPGFGANTALYDVLGRMYRVGVRLEF